MNIRSVIITTCIALSAAVIASDGPVEELALRLSLRNVTPRQALERLHNVWEAAGGTSAVPPVILIPPHGLSDTVLTLLLTNVTPRRVLQYLKTNANLRYVIYENAVIVFKAPEYSSGLVQSDALDITDTAARALGVVSGIDTDAHMRTEAALGVFGISFPCAGCWADYDSASRVLNVAHVKIEREKARVLLKRLNSGVSPRDMAVDPTLYLANEYEVYDNGDWTQHARK